MTIAAICFELLRGSKQVVQTIASPDRRHTAKLIRQSDSELRFQIEVDGRRVFSSSDFDPDARLKLGETIAWDKTGQILTFEVAGRPLFTYDINRERSLTTR